jgi:hypothetical protein
MSSSMSPLDQLAMALDPALTMERLGLEPDPWQRAVLRSMAARLLLLCCRQSGKSTTTAILALHTSLFQAGSLILLLSPSLRQSGELFRKVAGFYADLGKPVSSERETALSLSLTNGSRVVSLPASPDTIRGYSAVDLLVIDEAAMVPDELWIAANPMLAVSQGRLICLSTPLGKRGWFHDIWHDQQSEWERVRVTAEYCPRIAPEFLAEQKILLGERWFRQEFLCSFEETVDQIFSTESVLGAFTSTKSPLFEPSGAAPPAPDTGSSKAPLYGV